MELLDYRGDGGLACYRVAGNAGNGGGERFGSIELRALGTLDGRMREGKFLRQV